MAPSTLTLYPEPAPEHVPGSGLRGLYNAIDPIKQIIRPSAKPVEEPQEDVVRPSIQFQPFSEDYEARVKRLEEKRKTLPQETLPEGFPKAIEGDRVWHGKDIKSLEQLMIHFSPADIEELEAALKHFKGKSPHYFFCAALRC